MKLSQETLARLVANFLLTADDITWNRFSFINWQDLRPELLTEKHQSAVAFITFVEDHLPGYFAEYYRVFPIDEKTSLEDCVHNRELYHFLVRWALEEDRHSHVLANYQLNCGLTSAEQLGRELATEGRKQFVTDFSDPCQIFIYSMLQEKATQLYYQQLRSAVREPVLRTLLRLLSRDEARHFAFFFNVVTAYIEEFGEGIVPHMRIVLHDFKMPLHDTLTNYWRWALEISDTAEGYNYTEAFTSLARVIDKYGNASFRVVATDILQLIGQIRSASLAPRN